MTGKEKCKILKEIRNMFAKENGIDFVASECTFEGECVGHCPKCDSEALFLENELRKIGKADKIDDIETVAALSSCVSGMLKVEDDIFNNEHDTDTLMGDIIPDDFNEW